MNNQNQNNATTITTTKEQSERIRRIMRTTQERIQNGKINLAWCDMSISRKATFAIGERYGYQVYYTRYYGEILVSQVVFYYTTDQTTRYIDLDLCDPDNMKIADKLKEIIEIQELIQNTSIK